ncbi:MAG: hypothetical protein JWP41_3614 [Ramlibacter sp.]|jgi:hypothetical protein|nr:hypothetical protein [Ramlibacter sp.]
MSNEKSARRPLQQQPRRESDPQQQRAGATDFQPRGVEGEGSYSASRHYQKNIRQYLEKADVQKDAEAARPRSDAEARDLEDAERAARSHSKGER